MVDSALVHRSTLTKDFVMMSKTQIPLHHPRLRLLNAMISWFKGAHEPIPFLRYGGVNPLKAFRDLHHPQEKKIFFMRRRRRLIAHNLRSKNAFGSQARL